VTEKKKKIKKDKKTAAEKWKELKKKSDVEFWKKAEQQSLKEWFDSDKITKPPPPPRWISTTIGGKEMKQLRKRK